MERAELYEFLAMQRYGVVASVGESGVAQSALVGIAVTPQLEIIFDTVMSSRKYGNLVRRPACSFVIGAGEQTVQYEGVAEVVAESTRERYLEAYFAAWPECRAHLEWAGIVHFVVHPRWVRFSDYDRTPALIEEMTVGGGAERVAGWGRGANADSLRE